MGFFAHLHDAFLALGGFGLIRTGMIGKEHSDLRERLGAFVKSFGSFALGVDGADEPVGRRIGPAAGRKLISDRVAAAEGLGAEAFIFERGLGLDAAEISPHFLKAAGLPEPRLAPMGNEPGEAGKVLIAPEARREGFYLEMGGVGVPLAEAEAGVRWMGDWWSYKRSTLPGASHGSGR